MLAIVIPYYKITFFNATLASLSGQTNKEFKVYIGSDNSLDDPTQLLEKYVGKFNFDFHKFDENIGSISLVQQWERCIALSKSEEWIMILGDDDFLAPNVVATFYEQLADIVAINSNLVRFATQLINNETNNNSKIFHHPKLERPEDSFYRKLKHGSRSSLSEYIFKREVYNQFKFRDFPLAWHSDDYAWMQFTLKAPIYTINEAVVGITISTTSISGRHDNRNKKNASEFQFFDYLIKERIHLFDKKQRSAILYHAELCFLNEGKIRSEQWAFFWKLYLKNFEFIPFLKFVRRYILGKLNK